MATLKTTINPSDDKENHIKIIQNVPPQEMKPLKLLSQKSFKKDPLDYPTFNFNQPYMCLKPYLNDPTIHNEKVPPTNPLKLKENSLQKPDKIDNNSKENSFTSDSIKEESTTVLLNGVQVNIEENALFGDCDCKSSGYFERENAEKNFLHEFEIGKILGKGRFGKVFLARFEIFLIRNFVNKRRHIPTKTIYALKMVNKEKAIQENVFHLIKREAYIQESLNHPNILKCYGSFEDKERFYLILEYTPNGDLYSNLRSQASKRFSEQEASEILYQILSGLSYLSYKKVIHRDLKGENIMNSMVSHIFTKEIHSIFKRECIKSRISAGVCAMRRTLRGRLCVGPLNTSPPR